MKQPQVIIDYALDTPETRDDLLRHIAHLQEYFDDAAIIEVTAYGNGLGLVIRDGGLTATDMKLAATFLACQNSMNSRGIDATALMVASIVPSGVGHLVERQQQGWAYLKA